MAELDPAVPVNLQNLHDDAVPFLDFVGNLVHPLFRYLRNVQQAVGAGEDFHKRSEVHDFSHGAHVNLTDLGFLGEIANDLDGFLRGLFIGRRYQDRAVVFDIDRHARCLNDTPDRLAAGSNDLAHFILVDLQRDDSRRIGRRFYTWPSQDALHLLQNVHAPLPGLFQSPRHDFAGHAGDLDVHLDGRDPLRGPRDLEVHVAQMILNAEDVRQNRDVLPFCDQPHRNARDRRLDGHPRVHKGKRAPAHRRHG